MIIAMASVSTTHEFNFSYNKNARVAGKSDVHNWNSSAGGTLTIPCHLQQRAIPSVSTGSSAILLPEPSIGSMFEADSYENVLA